MFLLASDFDKTFYINNYDFKNNVEALKTFRKNNLFAIVTGRSYQDYMNITKNYVPVDYLVINHGATILKNGKIVRSVYIDSGDIDKLKKLFDFNSIEYFATSDIESRVDINHKNISKINISMQDNLVAKKAVDFINDNFKSIKAYVLFHKNQFEIVSTKANKRYALEYIGYLENIDKSNIYTVGDGYTDIEMIKYYRGFAIKDSVSALKKVAFSIVNSVSDIIKFLDVEIKLESVSSEITHFINKCYNYNNYFEKYMAKIYDNKSSDKNHVVIRKDNEIIGCALLFSNKLYIGSDSLDVLEVGSICVKEEYRGKGYLKILMGFIKEEEKKYDLSILSGDASLYSYYGYYPNILNLYKINSKHHDNITFKTINDDYIMDSLDLYNKDVHSNRTTYNFKDILKQWKCDSYYIFKDNNYIGYLIYNTKQDYINEIKTSNLIDVVESFGTFKNRKYINLSVLNNDYDDKINLINKELDLSKMYNRKLYSINNLEKVINTCLNYKLKYNELVKGSISIKIDNEIIKISNYDKIVVEKDTKYDIELTREQFINILLNKKISSNELFASWFYLDLDIYHNDLV